jgi:TIR domain
MTGYITKKEVVVTEASFDVFISYRRSNTSDLAQLVRNVLTNKGFKAFLDVREMPSGSFPYALATIIQRSPDFVPIISVTSFPKPSAKEDFYLMELQLARKHARHIVPILVEPMVWESEAGSDIQKYYRRLQGVSYSHQYSDAALDEVTKRLSSKPGGTGVDQSADSPMAVTDHNNWGLSGSVREVSYVVGNRSHVARLERTDRVLWNIVNLYIDGTSILRKEVFFPHITTIDYPFTFDGMKCRLMMKFRGLGWWGWLECNGVKVLDEPSII